MTTKKGMKEMPDYAVADELADKIFAVIARDDQLSPETHPNEMLTIAMQLVISVLRAIDDPGRREYACNLLTEKIRNLPDLWRDNGRITFH
jgi:hypothetical protein